MSQQQKGFEEVSVRDSFNLVHLVLIAQATCVTPFTRIGFGAEALGIPGIAAFIALCFWVVGTASFHLEVMTLLWFVAMLVQRGKTLIDGMRGHHEHSRYTGYPYLTALLCKHETLAKLMEGTFILVAGLAMEGISWPVGHLLMASGGAIIFLEGIHRECHRKLEQARRDSVLEMQTWGDPSTGKPQWRVGRR